VLPFQREKVDYLRHQRVLERVKGIKREGTMTQKKLRRQINREDDSMILNMLVRPALEKQYERQKEAELAAK